MPVPRINLSSKEKLPEVLFYKRPASSVMKPPQDEFVAFSTKGDMNYCEMLVHKSSMQNRQDYSGKTLAIDFIKSKEKRKGLGTAMLDFAKNYSKKNGCNGYLVLRAESSIDKSHVPHIFYRKQEFTTLDKKLDKKLDMFIRKNKDATSDDFATTLMYYPAPQQKPSFLERLKEFLTF